MIKSTAASSDHILANPYPGLTSPIVMSAWSRQLTLKSVDDPRFKSFITTYLQGPRTPELGAMRAIGFLPRHVRAISVTEGAMLGGLGGLLGVTLSQPILTGFGKALSSLGFLTGITFKPGTALLTLVLAAVIGALASVLPAWQAGRMEVVDALRTQE